MVDSVEAYRHEFSWRFPTLIQELGIGATELLIDDTILLPEDLKEVLQRQYDRTVELEKQVMSLLVTENQPANVANLRQDRQISSSDLLNALQSLSRRCLIEKLESLYTLPSVLKQYIAILAGVVNFLPHPSPPREFGDGVRN